MDEEIDWLTWHPLYVFTLFIEYVERVKFEFSDSPVYDFYEWSVNEMCAMLYMQQQEEDVIPLSRSIRKNRVSIS